MTPQEYEDLTISWELDPPAEERLRKLIELLAQSIADQRNMHQGKDAAVVHAATFLDAEPKDEDDEDEQPEQPIPPDVGIAFGARQRNMPLVTGHGSKLPSAALSAFFPKTEGES